MKLMVTGHRIEKLANYDQKWIQNTISDEVLFMHLEYGASIGISGMASGVDLWFCDTFLDMKLPFYAYTPFDDQPRFMTEEWAAKRAELIGKASEVVCVRNSRMVETCDMAMVVWDGNKGGTHNCFQQLLETKKPICWIVPNRQQVIYL